MVAEPWSVASFWELLGVYGRRAEVVRERERRPVPTVRELMDQVGLEYLMSVAGSAGANIDGWQWEVIEHFKGSEGVATFEAWTGKDPSEIPGGMPTGVESGSEGYVRDGGIDQGGGPVVGSSGIGWYVGMQNDSYNRALKSGSSAEPSVGGISGEVQGRKEGRKPEEFKAPAVPEWVHRQPGDVFEGGAVAGGASE